VHASAVDGRQLKAPFLEALQVEHEARPIPEENLHLVARLADEDEEMPCVGVVAQRALDDGA